MNGLPDPARISASTRIGFYFWPADAKTVQQMGELAVEHGYDLVGVADTPGQSLDCWVSATLLSAAAPGIPIAVCVTNFASRHWTTTGSAAASVAEVHGTDFLLGVGAGHSAMRNFGLTGSTAGEMEELLEKTQHFICGEDVPSGSGSARLGWVNGRLPKIFLAASHDRSLAVAGRAADGVFINYGLQPPNIADSTAKVRRAETPGTVPTDIWQIAALDCAENGDVARTAVGKMCAFIAGYVIGKRDPVERGVPPELAAPMRTLVERYSTRPSQADSDLVAELGLTDYLHRRVAVCGDPQECLGQTLNAVRGGAHSLMFSVSRASDPVRTVDLFGRNVLPVLRARDAEASGG
jgi:alkanesulfonate monooxygenase SsuD/methylene tetrahydromethanopterin reductase-like flavin-dependent oxidoreductase (luciferase family)